ncbi:TetR/AcrR family transcriptional regulator [Pseudooceanicola sp. LIPI14-2-Ac024]|uniref:TetR/AcrR family transcriptional regulator n=1 Tax=Pseudooceanicola sp. LIPI14-2-Ac024 TaxID=3344875 RepID=UPI0035D0577B
MKDDITETVPATTRRGRKPARVSRRDDIARIAMGLFARNGFDGTSIRDIAEAAGLTKPALYYHFQDKEALYEYVLVERMTRLNAAVKAAVETSDDPLAQIGLFLETHARRMDEDRTGWVTSRQSFTSITDPERRARVTRLRDEFEHLLRDRIETAMQRGLLDRSASASTVARMLLSAVNDLARWMKPGGDLTAQEVARSYVEITLRGLGAARA